MTKPWLTDGIIMYIKRKIKLYANYVRNPILLNEKIYKQYRNRLNHVLRIAEWRYCRTLLADNKHN